MPARAGAGELGDHGGTDLGPGRVRRRWAAPGCCTRDLTAECAAAVQAVLDALPAPADAEDTRTQEQRWHDALGEAMR